MDTFSHSDIARLAKRHAVPFALRMEWHSRTGLDPQVISLEIVRQNRRRQFLMVIAPIATYMIGILAAVWLLRDAEPAGVMMIPIIVLGALSIAWAVIAAIRVKTGESLFSRDQQSFPEHFHRLCIGIKKDVPDMYLYSTDEIASILSKSSTHEIMGMAGQVLRTAAARVTANKQDGNVSGAEHFAYRNLSESMKLLGVPVELRPQLFPADELSAVR